MRLLSLLAVFSLGCSQISANVRAEANFAAPAQGAQKHIVFNKTVDDDSVHDFIAELNEAAGKQAAVIVELNTPGGSVGAGFEMGKAIENSKIPVICVVDGMAASMGLYILQSCQIRVMTNRSLLMGHEPSSLGRGQPHDLEKLSSLLRKLSRAMAYHIAARTALSVDEYLAKVADGREFWLTADEALKLKFVDFAVDRADEMDSAAEAFAH